MIWVPAPERTSQGGLPIKTRWLQMKIKLLVIAALALIPLASSIRAETPDYSAIEGDFKIFCLGDSPEVVKNKIDYLVQTGITEERFEPHGFATKVFGESMYCGFEFYNDMLWRIQITSWRSYLYSALDTSLKDITMNRIRKSFVELYGKPTKDYGYPMVFNLKEGWITYISQWVLDKKTITIGIRQIKFKLAALIWITDNKLDEAKTKEEAAKAAAENDSSKKDF
jgi:hypothetical protein